MVSDSDLIKWYTPWHDSIAYGFGYLSYANVGVLQINVNLSPAWYRVVYINLFGVQTKEKYLLPFYEILIKGGFNSVRLQVHPRKTVKHNRK